MTSHPAIVDLKASGLEPVRYIMSAEHMASCFHAIGLKPPKSELYTGLPQPTASLPKNVVDSSGTLNAQATAMFKLLANPKRVVIANEFFGGHIDGIETRFIGDDACDVWVIVSKKPDNIWDLALLTTEAQFLAMMDAFGGFSERPVQPGAFMVHLSLEAMAALSTIADTVRLSALRQELKGLLVDVIWQQSFSVQGLLSMSNEMRTQVTVKSKVLLLHILSAGATSTVNTAEQFKVGINDLIQAGLLDDDSALSFDGHQIISHIIRPETVLSFHTLSKTDTSIIAESLFLLQTPQTILGGIWQRDDKGDVNSAVLMMLQPEQALKLLEGAVKPKARDAKDTHNSAKATIKFCPECGAKNDRNLKFCSKCGTKY